MMDCHKLAVTALGGNPAGRPVVFLHGFGGSLDAWPAELIFSVGSNHCCYAISLPGHFPSTCACEYDNFSLSAVEVTNAVARAIESIDGTGVILIGHSAGGWLALRLAAALPERIIGVAVANGFTAGRFGGLLGRLQSLARHGHIRRWLARSILWIVPRQFLLFWIMYAHLSGYRVNQYSKSFARRFLKESRLAMKRHDRSSLTLWLAMLYADDCEPLLADIRSPVLLIHGERDPVIAASTARNIAKQLPVSCDVSLLPGTGHLPFVEALVDFESRLNAWLEKLRRPPDR